MDIRLVKEQLTQYFSRREDVAVSYLFGSLAKGNARQTSDIDVAVLFKEAESKKVDRFFWTLDIAAQLESLTGHKVDVVDLSGAPLSFIHQVLKTGEILVESCPARRVEFEVRARREYFDMLPYYQRYVEVMRQDVKRGDASARRRGDPGTPEIP